jgi:hypothetical protein
MAVPVPRTWVASEFETATIMNGVNGIRDAMNFMLAPPRVSAYRSANQTLTTSTWAVVPFDAEEYDPAAMHSTASNTSRLIAVETGIYTVSLFMIFGASATGQRNWEVRKNAAGSQASGTLLRAAASDSTSSSLGLRMFRTFDVPLNSGDYIELFAWQSSGGNLILQGGGIEDTNFQMRWFGKQ